MKRRRGLEIAEDKVHKVQMKKFTYCDCFKGFHFNSFILFIDALNLCVFRVKRQRDSGKDREQRDLKREIEREQDRR